MNLDYDVKKIVIIDIGTHLGQEILSLFNPLYVFFKASKLTFTYLFFRKRLSPSMNTLKAIRDSFYAIITSKKISRYRNRFILIGIEPNTILFSSPAYKLLDLILPIAIGESDSESLSIRKLYIGSSDPKFKGNSIYSSKENVDSQNFTHIICSNPTNICNKLSHLNLLKEADIILRLNCEGSEDDIIYSAFDAFGERLIGIMGNLSDVSKVKSQADENRMMEFIQNKNIPLIKFDAGPQCWFQAHRFILKILNQRKYN